MAGLPLITLMVTAAGNLGAEATSGLAEGLCDIAVLRTAAGHYASAMYR